ncbi:MAG: hypothetical protein V7607_5715 [Solirubrobacteraceae bacterium]
MKVLITGAAGRVGANVVKRLVASGAEVRALVMPGDPNVGKLATFPEVEVVEGDVRSQDSLNAACQGVTHVVHLAAQMVRGDTPVDTFFDINSFSTLRLVEAVRREGDRFERFVLASTDATYRPADPPATPLTEDVAQAPADTYGTSKLLGEVILRNRAEQFEIPFSIVRFGTVLSPEEADKPFRLAFLRGWVGTQQAQGRDSTFWPLFGPHPGLVELIDASVGDAGPDTAVGFTGPQGPWTLSMIDVRDAAQGVCKALTAPGALGRSFNVAAGDPVSYEAAASAISELYGVPKLTVQMPMTWRLEISIEAARQHIGYEPAHTYRDTLAAGAPAAAPQSDDFIPAAERDSGVFAKLAGSGR